MKERIEQRCLRELRSKFPLEWVGMGEEDRGELEMLKRVCTNLGAPEGQAKTMASQLLKRAGQLATERGSSREDELNYLLELVIAGREGKPVEDRMRSATEDTARGK